MEEIMATNLISELTDLLKKNYNLIIHGAPGTGKTYTAIQIAEAMGAEWDMIQLHPSYDYTDFMESYERDRNGEFRVIDGIFKKFCEDALNTRNKKFVFIIDDINRGETSRIFGEALFAINPAYRGAEKCKGLRTRYAGKQFGPNAFDAFFKTLAKYKILSERYRFGHFFVPENVYIIGTMNNIDHSVESMDLAMRRRFTFREIAAESTQENILAQLDESIRINAKIRMDNLNNAIWNDNEKTGELSSSDYHIGAAYFTKLKDLNNDFDLLWEYNLKPLLREYLRGQGDIEIKLETLKKMYDYEL